MVGGWGVIGCELHSVGMMGCCHNLYGECDTVIAVGLAVPLFKQKVES